MPWGEELVELLFCGSADAGPDRVLCLQVKPNGVSVSRRGGVTDPPTSPTRPWDSNAVVAATVDADAWFVEARVPRRALEQQDKRVLGFNVLRLDAQRGSTRAGAEPRLRATPRTGSAVSS